MKNKRSSKFFEALAQENNQAPLIIHHSMMEEFNFFVYIFADFCGCLHGLEATIKDTVNTDKPSSTNDINTLTTIGIDVGEFTWVLRRYNRIDYEEETPTKH